MLHQQDYRYGPTAMHFSPTSPNITHPNTEPGFSIGLGHNISSPLRVLDHTPAPVPAAGMVPFSSTVVTSSTNPPRIASSTYKSAAPPPPVAVQAQHHNLVFSRPYSHPTSCQVTPGGQGLVFRSTPHQALPLQTPPASQLPVSKSAPGVEPRLEDVRELARDICCREDVAAQLLRLTPSGTVAEARQFIHAIASTPEYPAPTVPPALPPRRPHGLPARAAGIPATVSSNRPGIVLRTAVSKEVARPTAYRAEPCDQSPLVSTPQSPSPSGSFSGRPPPLPPKPSSVASSSSVCGDEEGSDSAVQITPPALPPRRRASETESASGVAGTLVIRGTSQPPQRPPAVSSIPPSGSGVVRPVSAQWAKFYMEQHFENLNKQRAERQERRSRLEEEMHKVGLSQQAKEQMRHLLVLKETHHLRMRRCKMDKRQFEKLKTLGVGAFGEVALVRKKDNGHLYAMKTLKKTEVLQRNQAAHVKAERDILIEADSEWVVKLYYSFQDERFLYLIMEYIPGGDLMSLLIKKGIFEEPLARFYLVEMVLALEGVHKLGFVHRDIKPDNILICANGHIKLTDFGLCTGFHWTHQSKYYMPGDHAPEDSMDLSALSTAEGGANSPDADNTAAAPAYVRPLEARKRLRKTLCKSLVGTPNYIAPEILDRRPYSKACDWWSVGVIAFEMLVGHPPFLAKTPAETQWKVINWKDYLRVPREAGLSPGAEDLIYKMCTGAENRLSDPRLIRQLRFFQAVKWDHYRNQSAPYVPTIRHELDTSNFDPVEEERWGSSGDEDDPSGTPGAGTVAGTAQGQTDGVGANGQPGAAAHGAETALDSTSKHQVFPEFTFRRFFDRENFH